MKNHLAVLPLFLLTGSSHVPAQAQRQVIIRLGRPQPAPPPQPEPGDVFRTDEDGNYIIERRRPSGETLRYRIVPRTKIKPEVTAELAAIGGAIRYSYQLRNAPGARQPIYWFRLSMSRPDLIVSTTSPSGWHSSPPADSLSGDPATRYKLSWFAEPDTNYNALGPGETIGLFSVEATALPGISKALLQGDLSREEAFAPYDHWDLSPWLLERINDVLAIENDSVQIPVVAPKYPLAELRSSRELAEAIVSELHLAAGMPEFQEHRRFLEDTAAYLQTAGKAAAGLDRQFEAMGTTALQKAFFRGMAINLRHLAKLP